ncbi:hypothetical protein EYF80_025845 [Liparis tanakae]|uniref:Uncharacterized protein n=1 Tax=Liparis tanakae TaxID=230148 RepID=A0A4Z2HGE8_9TELE|nr:hypothetical protein EYF80_025845 [Liparis tanakae]
MTPLWETLACRVSMVPVPSQTLDRQGRNLRVEWRRSSVRSERRRATECLGHQTHDDKLTDAGSPSLSAQHFSLNPGSQTRRRSDRGYADLIDQTISLFSGTHFTLPTVVLNLGESASVGTGMWISTLLAVERLLNWLFAWDDKNKQGSVYRTARPRREIYGTHVGVETVGHELKLSIGRNEGDGAVVLKARQTDTLQ